MDANEIWPTTWHIDLIKLLVAYVASNRKIISSQQILFFFSSFFFHFTSATDT